MARPAQAKGALQPQELLRAYVLQASGLLRPRALYRAYDWDEGARGLTDGGSEHAVLVAG